MRRDEMQGAGPNPAMGGPVPIAAEADFDDEIHLREYLLLVWRRRWTVIGCFLAVLTLVTLFTFTATPIFQAETKLLVEEDQGKFDLSPERMYRGTSEFFENQVEILKSRPVAETVVGRFKLHEREAKKPGALARLIGFVKSFFVGSKELPEGHPDLAKRRFDKTVQDLQKTITISPIRDTAVVKVMVENESATEAAKLAKAMAEAFIAKSLELKTAESRQANEYLTARLADVKQRLLLAEAQMKKFQEEKEAVSLDKKIETLVDARIKLYSDVDQVSREIAEKTALFQVLSGQTADVRARAASGDIGSLSELRKQRLEAGAKLEALQRTYTKRHPEVQQTMSRIEVLDKKIREASAALLAGKTGTVSGVEKALENYAEVERELNILEARKISMENALKKTRIDMQNLLRLKGQYALLQRESEAERKLYESLLLRQKEAGLKEALQIPDVKVIEPATVPDKPSKPKKLLNLLLGAIVGLMLGVGAAFALEYFDTTLKSKEEIQNASGLPTLATVDLSQRLRNAPRVMAKVVYQDSKSVLAESFRTLRTNVKFSTEAAEKVIMVTSSGPGEGKTTVASNLAIAFAQAGDRTLLLDLDLRKPRVQAIFSIGKDHGIGKAVADEFAAEIQKTQIMNLEALPAGGPISNPAELLAAKLKPILDMARANFDRVICDTPPVNLVADAGIIAQQADGVVFVTGSGVATKDSVRNAIESLTRLGARFLGNVVNRHEHDSGGYYYKYGYRYGYGAYGSSRRAYGGDRGYYGRTESDDAWDSEETPKTD